MRKTAIFSLFILMSAGLMAQSGDTNQFRPSKGNFSVEVNFRPFSTESPIGIDGFRGRYFLGNKLAIRTGFNIGYKKRHNEQPETMNGSIYYTTTDEKYTILGLNTGIEYHFYNSKRFSPYIGLIIGYENETSSSSYEDLNSGSGSGITIDKTDITNAWMETSLIQYYDGYYGILTQMVQRGYSKLSANAVVGADFYLFRHFYMGLELGVGYNTLFYKEVTFNVNGVFKMKYPNASDSNIGLNLNNAIRVGFWF
ncbi:MAG: hypothetical protein NTX61_18760 [Bacteroidetes bacterium]|nr:hypothetical protein [Bacteroidota bacterium]